MEFGEDERPVRQGGDVSGYISRLETRITKLEDNLTRLMTVENPPTSLGTLQTKIDCVQRAIDGWKSSKLTDDIESIERQLAEFTDSILPKAIAPYSNILAEQKETFNSVMTNAGKQYIDLKKRLSTPFESFTTAKADLSEFADVITSISKRAMEFPKHCEVVRTEFAESTRAAEEDIKSLLTSLEEQIKLELIRSKTSTASSFDQARENCEKASFKELADSIQTDLSARYSAIEKGIIATEDLLKRCEDDWMTDIASFEEEIQSDITQMQKSLGSDYYLQKRLEELQKEVSDLEAQLG